MAYLDESGLARYDGLLKNWVEEDALIKAEGSTTARTLPERFADVVNVKDFGAKGDGITDDTTAIQASLNAGALSGKTVLFPAGLYITSTSLVVENNEKTFCVDAKDATVRLTSSESIKYAFSITAKADVFISGLHLDANKKAYIGIYVCKEDTEITANVDLRDVSVENVYRAGTEFTGGDGILVAGEFENVRIINPVIKNCVMAANAGILGSQGIFGITTTRLSVNGEESQSSDNVYIENPYIENVYCEDETYIGDQDGIRCFSNYEPTDAKSNPDSFTIVGGFLKSVRGRAVKGQTHNCNISNMTVVYGDDPAEFSGVLENVNTIDMQVGGGNISNIAIFCDGIVAQTLVRMDLYNTQSDEVHAYGNISDIRATVAGISQADVGSIVLRPISVWNRNESAVHAQTANISNVTIESSVDFSCIVSVNTGSLSSQHTNANISNIGGPCTIGLVHVGDSGTCFCNLVNSINTANSAAVDVYVQDATKHKVSSWNCWGASNSSKIIAKGNHENVSYAPGYNDVLTVVNPAGNTGARILGGGSYAGNLYIGTENVPNAFLVSSTDNSVVFSVKGTNLINLTDWSFRPNTDNSFLLGSTTLRWKEAFITDLHSSGITVNSVNRTLADCSADIVNVKNFGAKGNGTDDDTAAFSAAVSAAGGAGVYVPAGTYVVNSNVSGNLFCFGGVTISGTGVVSTLKDLTS